MNWIEDCKTRHFEVNGARIFARVSRGAQGVRPARMLLHGFPQCHVMWHRVAQRLQQDFYLVLPDLRGYGDSSKAPGLPDHSNYSKRTLVHDMVTVMNALDHPRRVRKLCVIDIAPTLDMYQGKK